jgi:rhodanese-related sulfurtransferase
MTDLSLAEAIQQDPLLIDVRTPEEFATGTVPEAINIPSHLIPLRLEEIPKDKPVIVFCQSGSRSGLVKNFLLREGYTNCVNGGAMAVVLGQMQ